MAMPFINGLKAPQLSIVLTTSLLVACGGGSGGGDDASPSPELLAANSADTNGAAMSFNETQTSASITRTGVVRILSVTGPQTGTTVLLDEEPVLMLANFYQINEPIDQTSNWFEIPDIADDSCLVFDLTNEFIQTLSLEDPRVNSKSLSAGDAISVLTPTGSWPDLLRFSVEDFGFDKEGSTYHSYGFENFIESLGPIPANSTLNISGDEFPAFDAVAIPYTPPLTNVEISNLRNNFLSADSELSWDGNVNSGSNSTIKLTGSILSDVETNGVIEDLYFYCKIVDDGEFGLPENMAQVINQYEINLEDISFSRLTVNADTRGSANVLVANESVYVLY